MHLAQWLLALALWAAAPAAPASYALKGARVLDLASGAWSAPSVVLLVPSAITSTPASGMPLESCRTVPLTAA
jgi:hypothetical protein